MSVFFDGDLYMKIKVKPISEKLYELYVHNSLVQAESIYCDGEHCYPQVFLEKCRYEVLKDD